MKSVLDWFIKNPIAANLLMLIILVGGGVSLKSLNNEFFPPIEPLLVMVSVPYPGAGPLEVEEQICLKIEEAISDVEGVYKITSTASQGSGRVLVEAVDDWDLQRLLNDVKNRVDAISTFPIDAERPVVRDFTVRNDVVTIVVTGGDSEQAIKEESLRLKDKLLGVQGVSQVELVGVRDYLVSVEIPEQILRTYNLNFEDISRAISASSLNLPAGQMRNESGDIQIQVYGQDYSASDFEDVVVIKNIDGSQVTLGQIADIRDTFEEKNFLSEYEGKLAAKLLAKVGQNPDTLGTAERIREFLASHSLKPGYKAVLWSDHSAYLKDRLGILAKNAVQGLVLVFILLLLFLRPLLAVWVAVGIAVAYFGTLAALPATGMSINVVSTFSFLLILGIVVDDAIVISENVYANFEKGHRGPVAASLGVNDVSKPVILAVITTLLVFVPLLFTPGMVSNMFLPVPVIAILALSFSLVESLLILPSHLSHLKPAEPKPGSLEEKLAVVRHFFQNGMNRFKENVFLPFLDMSLANRGATLATFLAILLVCLSLLLGGWLRLNFMPSIEGETLTAKIVMQEGVGFKQLKETQTHVSAALDELRQNSAVRNYDGSAGLRDSFASIDGSEILVEVNLSGNEERGATSSDIQGLWRDLVGELRGVESISFYNSDIADQKDINLQLAGPDVDNLRRAAGELTQALGNYNGVIGINDSLSSARQEIRIVLKPHAQTLGLNLQDIARQVRHAFYGAEAQRIPRLREDVKVLVRYPESERKTIENLVDMRIKLADGTMVPFVEVAEAEFVPGYTTIERSNRSRIVDIFADVVPGVANANEVFQQVMNNDLPKVLERYPDVRFVLEGDQLEMSRMISALSLGLLFAMMVMYGLLAVEFRSYLQPLYILSAVPFGIAGAIIGHLVTGITFSFPSGFGVLATAGVVVNSNLVLIDRVNNIRARGVSIIDAMRQGAGERLRPILLTMLTTFFGLFPILLETSPSAMVLKPMVVSLSFGVVFATTITLLMVPALYVALESFKERMGFETAGELRL